MILHGLKVRFLRLNMQINTPDDLFKIYAFSDEAKLEIKQLFNANKVFVLQINALCLSIKDEPYKAEFTKLDTNTYLAKLSNICVIYKIENNKIFFCNITLSKK